MPKAEARRWYELLGGQLSNLSAFEGPAKQALADASERYNAAGSYGASPKPSARNRHYYPGGRVAGRPVPQGWYSEPWWRPALVGGAWGLGSVFLFSAMFGPS